MTAQLQNMLLLWIINKQKIIGGQNSALEGRKADPVEHWVPWGNLDLLTYKPKGDLPQNSLVCCQPTTEIIRYLRKINSLLKDAFSWWRTAHRSQSTFPFNCGQYKQCLGPERTSRPYLPWTTSGGTPTPPAQKRHFHPAPTPLSLPERYCRCIYLSPLPSLLDGPWTRTVASPQALSLALSAAALDRTSWMEPRPSFIQRLALSGAVNEACYHQPSFATLCRPWAQLASQSPLAHGTSLLVEQPCRCCSLTVAASNKYWSDAVRSLPLKSVSC